MKSPEDAGASSTAQLEKARYSRDAIVRDLHLDEGYKVITDPVWTEGIWISRLEASLMDTDTFQRQHWILQLGSSIHVYPGATHTRFEHSVGTLEAVQRILHACGHNAERYSNQFPGVTPVGPYERVVGRLAGLLHDLAQMPFAHTLDENGEGHLLRTEWDDPELAERLLGDNGRVQQVIDAALKKVRVELQAKIPGEDLKRFSKEVVDDLRWILVKACQTADAPFDGAEYRSRASLTPQNRHRTYLRDIVGNTFCADLIDYVQRDLLSVGMAERMPLRPVQFMLIREVDGELRPVIALWKPSKPNHRRRDVVSEVLEFVEMRYRLGERVYYHHAKMAAAAMVIKAVDRLELSTAEIWDHSDSSLLQAIRDQGFSKGEGERKIGPKNVETAANLIRDLMSRDLFKQAWNSEDYEPSLGEIIRADNRALIAEGRDARSEQRKLEELIADALGLDDGDVIVYAPNPGMNEKELDALVWPKQNEKPIKLKDLPAARSESQALMKKHQSLWRLIVFVRPKVLDESEDSKDDIERVIRSVLFKRPADLLQLAEVFVRNRGPEIYEAVGWKHPTAAQRERLVKEVAAYPESPARGAAGRSKLFGPLPSMAVLKILLSDVPAT